MSFSPLLFFQQSVLSQQVIDRFSQKHRLGDAGLLRELYKEIMAVDIQVHRVRFTLRFSHCATLATILNIVI